MRDDSQKTGHKRGSGRVRGRGFGPGGQCVCPFCGTDAPHKAGIPCLETKCPKCGASMTRAGR